MLSILKPMVGIIQEKLSISFTGTPQEFTTSTADQQHSSESDEDDKHEGDEEKEAKEPSFVMGGN